MTPELALEINQFIDRIHSPYYWSFFAVIAIIYLLEVFLPEKKYLESGFDRWLTYFKISIVGLFALVAISQGVTGGCVIQIPQNWLARNYLGMEYWHPYGLVFREYLDPQYWIFLRIFYLLGSFLTLFVTWKFWKKRVYTPLKNGINHER